MYPKPKKPNRKEIYREIAGDKENIIRLGKALNALSVYAEKTQKELLALLNALKKRGIVDELILSQERTAIEEMIRMEKQATIL